MSKKSISQAAAALGKKGGQVKVAKGFSTMTPERRSEIAKAAAAKRWNKKQGETKVTPYSIETTPAGKGFAYGDTVRQCETWEEAIEGAKQAAAECDWPIIFWAVERELPSDESMFRPVIRKQEFGAPSPFRPGKTFSSGAA
jgi:hypothetical protein